MCTRLLDVFASLLLTLVDVSARLLYLLLDVFASLLCTLVGMCASFDMCVLILFLVGLSLLTMQGRVRTHY